MKKRYHILIVGNNNPDDCSMNTMTAITQNGIFEVTVRVCFEDAIKMIQEKLYSIVIIDLDYCDFEQTVFICEKIRKESKETILIVLTSQINDYLFDRKLLDIPIDDFLRKPITEDIFKRRLLLWSIRYRKRILNNIDADAKMKEYQLCLNEMKKLEKHLKEILGTITDG
jgi:PleD family two-component response regulator